MSLPTHQLGGAFNFKHISHIYKRNCNKCGKYYERDAKCFCSHKCYWTWLKGKPSGRKTGKNTKCLKCHKLFYICLWKIKEDRGKYCSKNCYSQALKGKRPFWVIGQNNYNWKGGRAIGGGYIHLKMPEHPFATKAGYIMEHRYCAEAYLGRFLDPKEVVHHIDENRANNLPKNLYVFISNSEHRKFHNNPHPLKSNLWP